MYLGRQPKSCVHRPLSQGLETQPKKTKGALLCKSGKSGGQLWELWELLFLCVEWNNGVFLFFGWIIINFHHTFFSSKKMEHVHKQFMKKDIYCVLDPL
jgi:hypothetical protein